MGAVSPYFNLYFKLDRANYMGRSFLLASLVFLLSFAAPAAFAKTSAQSPRSKNSLCQEILVGLHSGYVASAAQKLREPEQFASEAPEFNAIDSVMNRNLIASTKKPKGKHKLYLTGEIAVLKELNDVVFKNKDLVTKLVDLHKEIFLKELLSNQHRQIYRYLDLAQSDFKTLRFAFLNDSQQLRREIVKIAKKANKKFVATLRQGNIKTDTASRRNLVKHAELWFLMGMGQTVDEAGVAARSMRTAQKPSELTVPHYDQMGKLIDTLVWDIEAGRQLIQERFEITLPELLQEVPQGEGKLALSRFAIKVLTKTVPLRTDIRGQPQKQQYVENRDLELAGYIDAVRLRLSRAYNISISRLGDADIVLLKEYISNLERLSPGILVEERVVLDFSKADFYIASMDFAGLNVWNFEQTQFALARMKPSENGRDALKKIRAGEAIATAQLEKRKEFVSAIYKEVFDQQSFFTGDDGAVFPVQLTKDQMKQVVGRLGEAFSEQPKEDRFSRINPDSFRQTFVNKDIGNVDAELLEKDLRILLEENLSLYQQENLVIAINLNDLLLKNRVEFYIGGIVNADILTILSRSAARALKKSHIKAIREANYKLIAVPNDKFKIDGDTSELDQAI